MHLKDGSVESLVLEQSDYKAVEELALAIFFQMLQALDHLAFHNFVHRDVKPANILYRKIEETYTFQLGDFGLTKRVDLAATQVGTELFGAPEVFLARGSAQTPAVDCWSLFVTMLWVLDVQSFRSRGLGLEVEARTAWIVELARHDRMKQTADMACVIPKQRASAAQMLVKCYGGVGLTTPRDTVVPLATAEETGLSVATAEETAPSIARPRRSLPRGDPMDVDS